MSESFNFLQESKKSDSPKISNLGKSLPVKGNTIINVETYDNEYSEKNLDLNTIISPRIKSTKKHPNHFEKNEEKSNEPKGKKGTFNEFLDKMEKFQKAKNEKINELQAKKKEQEELELLSIPKVKMSQNSKKILENKNKKTNTIQTSLSSTKVSIFTPSPTASKLNLAKNSQSNSGKNVLTKNLFENNPKSAPIDSLLPKPTPIKENPSLLKSERVLAAKFIKEYNNKFDEISQGAIYLNIEDTVALFQNMYFINTDSDYFKMEAEEKLFKKFWKISGAEENEKISMENLKNFLLGVMNIFLPNFSHNEESNGFGKIIGGKLLLNQEDVIKVHRTFLPFYENRMENLKKIAYQNKVDKYAKMQDIFKNLKCKETKITIGSFKSKDEPEIKKVVKEKPANGVKMKNSAILKQSEKKAENTSQRIKGSKTPKPKRKPAVLDSSFQSTKSLSRPHSRLRISKQNSLRDISVNDSKINADQISDPSVLTKALDILGQFSNLSGKKENPHEKDQKINEKSETNEKIDQNELSTSSKLIYQKKSRLKSINSKNIDDRLKKAADILKQNKMIDELTTEEILVDVNMPNGTHKTLIIPPNADPKQAVSKFVKDNKLSLEMGKTLLNSIQNS